MQGRSREVPFQPDECRQLLKEASTLLEQINQIIDATTGEPSKAMAALARPDPVTCRLCLFRPACSPYEAARQATSEQDDWPSDVLGVVFRSQVLHNGTLVLRLRLDNSDSTITIIRGLDPDPDRHPVLAGLRTGEAIAVYNLKRASPGVFDQTDRTVIYRTPLA